MADVEVKASGREVYLVPILVLFRVLGLFFDVLTLMVRLLFNTLVYDSPTGKNEVQIGVSRSADETSGGA